MTSIVESQESDVSKTDDDKLLSEAKARFKLADEAEQENRRLAIDDLKFRAGEQWDPQIKAQRDKDRRPCLVINRIPQFLQQVTNDQRQNRPSIKAHPVDDKADTETAKVIQGLIRHIEYNSNADVAYDTAFDSAASCGWGYWRIVTDYADPLSFEQEIYIKRVPERFSVFFDPYSQEPDGSDANWGFIIEDLSRDEYMARYKNSKLASSGVWDSIGNSVPDWITDTGCRVAEYFYKEHEEREIYLLDNGMTVLADGLSNALMTGANVVRKRTASVPIIRWCKLNGFEVLEKTDWLGKWIPIVPVYGSELVIDGKRILEGIIRNAKDPARMYNYWKSAETEAIALAPRAPFIVAEGQLEGYENDWATANTRNHAFLQYRPTSINGTPVPPPQRNSFEPAVQAITQASMFAADDIKATTGIYDAAMGARSNETSGVAIQRRNVQAQTSNFHFIDNLTRSLRHTGRILIDLIPKVYDTARVARIIGEDGTQKVVKINQPSGKMGKDGQELVYNLDAGKYDVTVDVGPSFATKRQEAAQSMMEVTRAVPQMMQVAGDLLVKNMDWPGAQEIADRLKKTLPPGLAEDPDQEKQPIPPQVQAQMSQMGQMVEQLTGKLNELQDEREQKLLELESKERIEMKKLEVQLEIERAKLDAKDALTLLNAEISQINNRLSLLRADQPIDTESEEFAPQPQPSGPMMMGAEMDEGMNPTGGESPGLPIEEQTDDDPSSI